MIRKSLLAPAVLAFSLWLLPFASWAQFPTAQSFPGQLQNLAMLKPPPGAKVAIIVFEDLGCPHCAAAHPIELAVSRQYHVPLIRYDAPIRSHVWTFQGAVDARYVQAKYGRDAGEMFRGDVFHAQMSIASLDDLQRFTQTWLTQHGKPVPMLFDPDGSLAKQVSADTELGKKLHLGWTPTLLVVTQDKQQVISGGDATHGSGEDLAPAVQAALSQVSASHASGKAHGR